MFATKIGVLALLFAVTGLAARTTTNVTQTFEQFNFNRDECDENYYCQSEQLATTPSDGLYFGNLELNNVKYVEVLGQYYYNIPDGSIYASTKNATAYITSAYNCSSTKYFKLESFLGACEAHLTYVNGSQPGSPEEQYFDETDLNCTIVVKGYSHATRKPLATAKFHYKATPYTVFKDWNMQLFTLPAVFSRLPLTKATFELINHTPTTLVGDDPNEGEILTEVTLSDFRVTLDDISYQTVTTTPPKTCP